MKFRIDLAPLSTLTIMALSGPVHAFDIGFDWSGLKSCKSGNHGTVGSIAFTFSNVPEGTAFICLPLVDRDVPGFNHGGVVVAWDRSKTVPAGAFKYKQGLIND